MPLTQLEATFLDIIEAPDTSPEMLEAWANLDNININCIHPETGETALHMAVKKQDVDLVKYLLEKGAKTNITDKKYFTPIQHVETSTEKNSKILGLLLDKETFFVMDDIENMLAFCQEFYSDSKSEAPDEKNLTTVTDKMHYELLNYAVSHLTRTNIDDRLDRNECTRYTTHLQDVASGKLNGDALEGWSARGFLALRIRIFFEIVLRIQLGLIAKHPKDMLSILKKELLNELHTLQIAQYLSILKRLKTSHDPNSPQNYPEEFRKQLTILVSKRIKSLTENDSFCFPGGWRVHQIYINFFLKENNIHVRVDNLGDKSNKHEEVRDGMYPYVFTFNLRLHARGYITNLVLASDKEKVDSPERLIYPDSNIRVIPPAELGYSPQQEQIAGNCVVANHNVGLRIRSNSPENYNWILSQESQHLAAIYHFAIDDIPLDENMWWKKYTQPRDFPVHLTETYSDRHAKTQIRFMLDDKELPLETIYTHLVIQQKVTMGNDRPDISDEKVSDSKENGHIYSEQKPHPHTKTMTVVDKQLLSVADIFNTCKTANKKQVILLGNRGVGKSTILQYVMQQWAGGKLWNQEFKWIFRISLRNLNSERYPKGDYTLLDVVCRECFPQPTFFSSYAKEKLTTILSQTTTLWLLDGYDDLPNNLPEYLKDIWKCLSSQNNFILTSLPQVAFNFDYQVCLQVTGFDNTHINHYVENYFKCFPSQDPNTASRVQTYLKENPACLVFAHTPINLELLCKLWRTNQLEFLNQKNPTSIVMLYEETTLMLLRNAYGKTHDRSSSSDKNYVLYCARSAIKMLEVFAFTLAQDNNSLISDATFRDILQREVPSSQVVFLQKEIASIGFLRPVKTMDSFSDEKREFDDFEFAHKTFQDFFAARYLASSLQLPPDNTNFKLAKEFIRKERYTARHSTILSLTAGILSILPDEKAISDFWGMIQSEPQDLTRLGHMRLLTACLHEAQYDARIPDLEKILKKLEERIKQILNKIINKNHNDIALTLAKEELEVLLSHPQLLTRISDIDDIINNYFNIHVLSPNITTTLIPIFKHKTKTEAGFLFRAIIKLMSSENIYLRDELFILFNHLSDIIIDRPDIISEFIRILSLPQPDTDISNTYLIEIKFEIIRLFKNNGIDKKLNGEHIAAIYLSTKSTNFIVAFSATILLVPQELLIPSNVVYDRLKSALKFTIDMVKEINPSSDDSSPEETVDDIRKIASIIFQNTSTKHLMPSKQDIVGLLQVLETSQDEDDHDELSTHLQNIFSDLITNYLQFPEFSLHLLELLSENQAAAKKSNDQKEQDAKEDVEEDLDAKQDQDEEDLDSKQDQDEEDLNTTEIQSDIVRTLKNICKKYHSGNINLANVVADKPVADQKLTAKVVELLNTQNHDIQYIVITLFQIIAPVDSIAIIKETLRLLSSPTVLVQDCAAQALIAMKSKIDQLSEEKAELVTLLDSYDFSIKFNAARVVNQLSCRNEHLPKIKSIMKAALTNENAIFKLSAAEFFVETYRESTSNPDFLEAIQALKEFSLKDNANHQRTALKILGTIPQALMINDNSASYIIQLINFSAYRYNLQLKAILAKTAPFFHCQPVILVELMKSPIHDENQILILKSLRLEHLIKLYFDKNATKDNPLYDNQQFLTLIIKCLFLQKTSFLIDHSKIMTKLIIGTAEIKYEIVLTPEQYATFTTALAQVETEYGLSDQTHYTPNKRPPAITLPLRTPPPSAMLFSFFPDAIRTPIPPSMTSSTLDSFNSFSPIAELNEPPESLTPVAAPIPNAPSKGTKRRREDTESDAVDSDAVDDETNANLTFSQMTLK